MMYPYNKGRTLEQIHGVKKAKEIRQKLRESHLGHSSDFKGKHHSMETRKKMSENRKGIPSYKKGKTLEEIYGIKRATQIKAKNASAHLGRPSPNKGKHTSLEVRKKMSEAHKGRVPWNKGLTKETDKRVALNIKNSGATIKKQFASGQRISYFKNIPSKYGKDAYHWQGGITPLNKWIRNLPENKRWIQRIFKRDKYTCQICKKKDCYLEAHHIIRFSVIQQEFLEQCESIENIPALVQLAAKYIPFWNIKNGITLCSECHNKTRGRKKRMEVLSRISSALP